MRGWAVAPPELRVRGWAVGGGRAPPELLSERVGCGGWAVAPPELLSERVGCGKGEGPLRASSSKLWFPYLGIV